MGPPCLLDAEWWRKSNRNPGGTVLQRRPVNVICIKCISFQLHKTANVSLCSSNYFGIRNTYFVVIARVYLNPNLKTRKTWTQKIWRFRSLSPLKPKTYKNSKLETRNCWKSTLFAQNPSNPNTQINSKNIHKPVEHEPWTNLKTCKTV